MAKEIGACQVTLKNINALDPKNHTREMLKKKNASCEFSPPPPPHNNFSKGRPLNCTEIYDKC